MKDLNKMISGLSKSGFMSGMAGGAVSGVITNLAMGKSGKKSKKTKTNGRMLLSLIILLETNQKTEMMSCI